MVKSGDTVTGVTDIMIILLSRKGLGFGVWGLGFGVWGCLGLWFGV